MPKIEYTPKRFSTESQAVIEQANTIIHVYQRQGFLLTVRQLYYQFVARALIPNTMRSYKRLGSIVNDGRLAGLIDWNAIEDRTRNLRCLDHWNGPSDIIHDCIGWYQVDHWAPEYQDHRMEVWIEKDALIGVIQGVCERWDVPYFSCRGYTSQSELWRAGLRLEEYMGTGQSVTIIHLGDHDPSGIDMTRDIHDRIDLFSREAGVKVNRIALNMDQVEKQKPPPNPAKLTDSRYEGYARKYGNESWELDALEPKFIEQLIERAIRKVLNQEGWDRAQQDEERAKSKLREISERLEG